MGACTSSVKTAPTKAALNAERAKGRGFGTNLDKNFQGPRLSKSRGPFAIAADKAADELMTMQVPDLESSHPADYKESDLNEPQMVSGYIDLINAHYRQSEMSFMSHPYMTDGTQAESGLSKTARGSLVNWLVEVHYKCRLKQETLPLAVNILDRFLSSRAVTKAKLQLVGAASFWVASKWVDIYPPQFKDLNKVSYGAFSKDELLSMERSVLNTLKFDLGVPTIFHFVERFLKASGAEEDDPLRGMTWCMAEICLTDYDTIIEHPPSKLAAGCVMLARGILGSTPLWHGILARVSDYTESELQACVDQIRRLHEKHKVNTGQPKGLYSYRKYTRSNLTPHAL